MSGVNSLLIQAVKGLLDESGKKYRSNMLALIVAAIVGIIGMIVYYILEGVEITPEAIVYIFLMVVAVWFVSMYGYDKTKQLIAQAGGINKSGSE